MLVGLSKDTFEELLRKAGIPCQYFCRKSFATWDVLLPSEEQAAKAAANDVITKHFRLQPEYKGTHRLQVTVCNVPAIIPGEVLAAYLSAFGQVEEYNLLRSPAGTAYGDYTFRLCFKAIPETLVSGDRQMMMVVEGRRPRCWGCKQIGHIAKFCPQHPENKEKVAPTATTTTTTKDIAAATTTTINKEAKAQGPGQVQPKLNNQEGWTEVTRKRRGSPKKGEKSPSSSPPQKQIKTPPAAAAVAVEATPEPPATPTPAPVTSTPATQKPAASPTTSTATPKTPAEAVHPVSPKKNKKKNKQHQIEEMETNTNLKEKRQWGRGRQKNMPWATQGRHLLSVTKATTSSTSSSTFTSASTTFPPSNITTYTNPSPNCHPLTPARTILQKMPPPQSNPSPKVTISWPVPAPESDQNAIPSVT